MLLGREAFEEGYICAKIIRVLELVVVNFNWPGGYGGCQSILVVGGNNAVTILHPSSMSSDLVGKKCHQQRCASSRGLDHRNLFPSTSLSYIFKMFTPESLITPARQASRQGGDVERLGQPYRP